jgi:hypothetical protein
MYILALRKQTQIKSQDLSMIRFSSSPNRTVRGLNKKHSIMLKKRAVQLSCRLPCHVVLPICSYPSFLLVGMPRHGTERIHPKQCATQGTSINSSMHPWRASGAYVCELPPAERAGPVQVLDQPAVDARHMPDVPRERCKKKVCGRHEQCRGLVGWFACG